MDFRVIYQGEKIMLIVREFSNRFQQMSGMPINSNETKERLKAAGIDINSKQYRAVMSESPEMVAVDILQSQPLRNE